MNRGCDIGARLRISLRTVESILANFMRKLDPDAGPDLIRHAGKRGATFGGQSRLIGER